MKVTAVALMATAATVAVADSHAHQHQHHHRHAHPVERDVTVTSDVPGPTTYAYVYQGKEISVDQVCQGIASHEMKFADGNMPSGLCSSSSTSSTSAAPTTTSSISTTSSAAATSAAEFYQKSWSSSSSAAPASSSAASSGLSGGQGVSSEFPDGTIDCSTFPSAYGAVSLDYLGLGGWSGLQGVTIVGAFVSNIVTGISGESCTEGMMCSYACPPGYQKSQWPSTQGSTGQSVGGLQCKGGKLYLTNPSLSKSLCVQGVGGVQATNNAGGVVSICRTDYPGTESETIPVELQPGSTEPLTCPDAAAYYSWEGQSTSAQYYLNPIGTPASTGCQWGSPGGNIGNYAPINFGVGAKDGTTWLSIFQNAPTTSAQYQGTVEIQGNLSGSCKYSNGQYCGATGCNSQGCTVSHPSLAVKMRKLTIHRFLSFLVRPHTSLPHSRQFIHSYWSDTRASRVQLGSI